MALVPSLGPQVDDRGMYGFSSSYPSSYSLWNGIGGYTIGLNQYTSHRSPWSAFSSFSTSPSGLAGLYSGYNPYSSFASQLPPTYSAASYASPSPSYVSPSPSYAYTQPSAPPSFNWTPSSGYSQPVTYGQSMYYQPPAIASNSTYPSASSPYQTYFPPFATQAAFPTVQNLGSFYGFPTASFAAPLQAAPTMPVAASNDGNRPRNASFSLYANASTTPTFPSTAGHSGLRSGAADSSSSTTGPRSSTTGPRSNFNLADLPQSVNRSFPVEMERGWPKLTTQSAQGTVYPVLSALQTTTPQPSSTFAQYPGSYFPAVVSDNMHGSAFIGTASQKTGPPQPQFSTTGAPQQTSTPASSVLGSFTRSYYTSIFVKPTAQSSHEGAPARVTILEDESATSEAGHGVEATPSATTSAAFQELGSAKTLD